MPRPLRSLRPSPTIRYSVPCRAQVPPSHLGCSPPSGNNESATRAPRNSKSTPGSHPSPNAAARNTGCIGDYSAPSSYAKRSSNGPARPFLARSGPLPTIGSSVTGDVPTKPPYAPWPSSGFESSIVAGRTARPMTNRHTSMRSNAAARHYSALSPRALRTLDSPPQGVGWAIGLFLRNTNWLHPSLFVVTKFSKMYL